MTSVAKRYSVASIMDEDYPVSQHEFESRFYSWAACIDYLTKLQWPNGFVCPYCEG